MRVVKLRRDITAAINNLYVFGIDKFSRIKAIKNTGIKTIVNFVALLFGSVEYIINNCAIRFMEPLRMTGNNDISKVLSLIDNEKDDKRLEIICFIYDIKIYIRAT